MKQNDKLLVKIQLFWRVFMLHQFTMFETLNIQCKQTFFSAEILTCHKVEVQLINIKDSAIPLRWVTSEDLVLVMVAHWKCLKG